MAKKQTRRSISVSRTTYERLKAFCETNGISMSQFVETRVGDFLGGHPHDHARDQGTTSIVPTQPRPTLPASAPNKPSTPRSTAPVETRPSAPAIPMTSAAVRFAVEPPPPVIKPKQEQPAPKPAEKRPDQIFTF
jgi:hypothetical protein